MNQLPIQSQRYAATALVRGQADRYVTLAAGPSAHRLLLARSPLAAARIWYWRLTPNERAACIRVVAGPWDGQDDNHFPLYIGPTLAYCPANGWRLVELDSVAQLLPA